MNKPETVSHFELSSLERLIPSTKKDRFNEVPGQEIELKLPLPSSAELDSTALGIISFFTNCKTAFIADPTIIEPLETVTKQFYYATCNKDNYLRKLFTISIRQRDCCISIKHKGKKKKHMGVILRKEQEILLPYSEWNEANERLIKEQESGKLSICPGDIFLWKQAVKRKLKVRLMQKSSHRVYTIGIVEKRFTQKPAINSCGIEYVGQEILTDSVRRITDGNSKLEIVEDINQIKAYLMSCLS